MDYWFYIDNFHYKPRFVAGIGHLQELNGTDKDGLYEPIPNYNNLQRGWMYVYSYFWYTVLCLLTYLMAQMFYRHYFDIFSAVYTNV